MALRIEKVFQRFVIIFTESEILLRAKLWKKEYYPVHFYVNIKAILFWQLLHRF